MTHTTLRMPFMPMGWGLAVAALTACAPALNWREVRPTQADGLVALFPCKPDAVQRDIVLPGLPDAVTMHLLSCEADGQRWVLSHLRVADVAQVPQALRALASATRGNLEAATRSAGKGRTPPTSQDGPAQTAPHEVDRQVEASELPPVVVPRMTPQPDARTWRFEAQRPGDGAGPSVPLSVTASHFSHGLTVFQASVWQAGEAASAHSGREAVTTFLQGFHFPG